MPFTTHRTNWLNQLYHDWPCPQSLPNPALELLDIPLVQFLCKSLSVLWQVVNKIQYFDPEIIRDFEMRLGYVLTFPSEGKRNKRIME